MKQNATPAQPVRVGEVRITADSPLTADQEAQLNYLFSYHAPEADDIKKYTAIRSAARALAAIIVQHCPPCSDRSAAIRKVREAVMTANSAIALKGRNCV